MSYEEDKFVIVKNLLSPEECEDLIAFVEKEGCYNKNTIVYDRSNRITLGKYERVDELFNQVSKKRLEILYPNEVDYESLLESTLKKRKYWSRFMWYKGESDFFPHCDAREEIMGILMLTKHGEDYGGGLYAIGKGMQEEVNLDSLCSQGDLLICDAHHFAHWVNVTQKNRGRLTYFVNFNPHSTAGAINFSTIQAAKNHIKSL